MKKILCIIIAAMMIASVSVNAVEVDEEVNDIEVVETVEDMPDEDVAEVADVDEPEDTPDEAPADLEDLPDLEDPVIDEPEDYPDADPDDEIAPVMLAAYDKYVVDKEYTESNGTKWKYNSSDCSLEFWGTVIKDDNASYNSWERLITQGTITRQYIKLNDKWQWVDAHYDDLPLKKIIFHDGITTIEPLTFNILYGDITIEFPTSINSIQYAAFGGLIENDNDMHGSVMYKGSSEAWQKLINTNQIQGHNSCISLEGDWYFQMYIPTTIELSPTNTSYNTTIYKAGKTTTVSSSITVADTTAKCGVTETSTINSSTKNLVTGLSNSYELSYIVFDTNNNNNKYGQLTLKAENWTTDYQNYTCSTALTFNFEVS